jgi:RNA polymerase sigma-70 factor (ECF subfamily)
LKKDEDIIASMKSDDQDALKDVFRLYFNRLYSFAIEFVIDREIAREIVHDSILRFWQSRHKLKDETNIKAYLLKIVRNLCLNHLKKYSDKPVVFMPDDRIKKVLEINYIVLADQNWDPMLADEFEEVISASMSSLPEKCRKVFELSRFENLSNAEIAVKLEISVKTVEGHITEAIKSIRQKISKY